MISPASEMYVGECAELILEIRRCAGTQFDPAIVLALEGIAGSILEFFQDRLSGTPLLRLTE
jgi:hypothetical protein